MSRKSAWCIDCMHPRYRSGREHDAKQARRTRGLGGGRAAEDASVGMTSRCVGRTTPGGEKGAKGRRGENRSWACVCALNRMYILLQHIKQSKTDWKQILRRWPLDAVCDRIAKSRAHSQRAAKALMERFGMCLVYAVWCTTGLPICRSGRRYYSLSFKRSTAKAHGVRRSYPTVIWLQCVQLICRFSFQDCSVPLQTGRQSCTTAAVDAGVACWHIALCMDGVARCMNYSVWWPLPGTATGGPILTSSTVPSCRPSKSTHSYPSGCCMWRLQ